MKLSDAIEKRRSVRRFKSKFVSIEKVIEIIDAGTKAPLAGNVTIMKCIIIEELETIKKIAQFTDQIWIHQADKIIAVCSNIDKLKQMYDEHAQKYAHQESGAAIQNMLLKATDLGLGACWVGSYLENEIRLVLKIPDNMQLEGLIVIGYPEEKPKAPHKTAIENFLYWEKWNQSKRPTIIQDPTTLEGKYN